MRKGIYEENGVKLSKKTLKAGDTIELSYTGLLKNSGAKEVKVHFGYNESWEDSQTVDMDLKDDAFVVSLTLTKAGTLNCAFVDPIGNWDNNSGNNYSFKISKGAAAGKTTRAKSTATKNTSAKSKKVKEPEDSDVTNAKNEAAPAKTTSKAKRSSSKKSVKEKK
jgi:hypothetical protein